jgi:hypothetical protein
MPTLQIDDGTAGGTLTVGYADEGSGPAVVVFHGTTMNRSAWDLVRAEVRGEHLAGRA